MDLPAGPHARYRAAMALSLVHVTFDCADPPRLAAFWSAALDRPIADGAMEFFTALEPAGPGDPAWFFIKVPEPKSTKNRVHVDLEAADRPAEVARLVSLGATAVSDHDEWGASWTVLTDPEGNEFCVGDPGH